MLPALFEATQFENQLRQFPLTYRLLEALVIKARSTPTPFLTGQKCLKIRSGGLYKLNTLLHKGKQLEGKTC